MAWSSRGRNDRVDTVPNRRAQGPIPLPPPQPIMEPGSAGNLRGIPVLAKGVGSTSPGTSPHVDGPRNVDRSRARLEPA